MSTRDLQNFNALKGGFGAIADLEVIKCKGGFRPIAVIQEPWNL
jgi:hypothetical protein